MSTVDVNDPRPDVVLIEAWRGGEVDAGEVLFARHYRALKRFFRNKVAADRVADLIQETFVAGVEARDRIVQGDRFRSYLLSIAYRVYCGHVRELHRGGGTVDLDVLTLTSLDPAPTAVVARAQEQRLLLEGLRAIAINYQVVLELHYWEELNTREIAEVLDVPVGTIRSRLQRARDALEAAMAAIARSPELLESTLTRLE
ncbi:MAG: sigma-70 family RNA polymerase sigma factor, partial [Myxococcales bacterium]|nr:sigma-70 family RNA polymerase sigma factor [Myxococcales bacterium]